MEDGGYLVYHSDYNDYYGNLFAINKNKSRLFTKRMCDDYL